MRTRLALVTGLSFFFVSVSAFAGIFPDVPDSHLQREAIEALVGKGVIGGNPDGTFHPDETVNRAAMLKMLYKAAGLDATSHAPGCFIDVARGSWYESYVCNAFAKGFVQGYLDKSFKPNQGVSRVEAAKLLTAVFGIDTPEISQSDRSLVNFTDLSTSEWYARPLYALFREGILPIVGMAGPTFNPTKPLTRGEAAAYIYNALKVAEQNDAEESEDELSASSVSTRSSLSSSSQSNTVIIRPTIPFVDTQIFKAKNPVSYQFSLTVKTTIGVIAMLSEGQTGGLTCRLYRLNDEGFSLEYYLGFAEGKSCYIRAMLAPGDYQLQLQPTMQNSKYLVDVKATDGDGNDGFSEAQGLDKVLRTGVLEGNDYYDWYTFVVKTEKEYIVEMRSSDKLGCLIYPMEDVDIFGFSGPSCNAPYLFPTGTYYVGVIHGSPKETAQTYSIHLK